MKIAILVAGLPPERIGGAETQARDVARRLCRTHDVRVYTRTSVVPSDLASQARCRVITRCGIRVPGLRFPADVATTLAHLWRDRLEIDVILAYQSVVDGLIAVLARQWLGLPVVVSVRGAMEYAFTESRQSRTAGAYVFAHADRIAVQSPAMLRGLLGAYAALVSRPEAANDLRRRVRLVPNGVDEAAPPSAPDSVLFVGRLDPIKGARFLIEAMRDCPSERLIVVGDGPERRRLEDAARGLSNVSFAGMVATERVGEYLERAKMLVVPSLSEGQPNVILEAHARGIPVIASNVGGVPDLVEDGTTGFLVEPGDVAALSDWIKRLGSDDGLRQRLSGNCVRAVARHHWPAVLETLEQTLTDAIADRRRTST